MWRIVCMITPKFSGSGGGGGGGAAGAAGAGAAGAAATVDKSVTATVQHEQICSDRL